MRPPTWKDLRTHLASFCRAALAAANPEEAVRLRLHRTDDALRVDDQTLPLDSDSRVLMVAFGKASLAMARGAMAVLGERVSGGVVVHPEGAAVDSGWPTTIQLLGGGHPLPNEGSLEAGACVADMVRGLRPADVLLVLVSGGGSAMLEILPPGLTLADLGGLTAALQHAGADITELNTVRRSLSLLKGGGLARLAHPARTITLLLSDVLGDRLETIASGPTVRSPTGPGDALDVLERHDLLRRFATIVRVLESRVPSVEESIQRSLAIHTIIGSNRQAAIAVEREADRLGFRPLILTTHLQGEAREVGRMIGGFAWSARRHAIPVSPPACLIFGGETTVTVRGSGTGGRNQELVLGAAVSLEDCERAAVFSFATDGVDGNSGASGAFATGETLRRARAAGLSVTQALADNDTGSFFAGLGDLWVTGPSGTNVNDLAIVLIYPI